MNIVISIVLGSLFGVALYWIGACNPNKILATLRLESSSLVKIILFAIGFSSVLLAGYYFLGIFDISHLSIKSTHAGVVLGGLLFGLGVGWGGTFPEACVATLGGEGIKRAFLVLIGGLAGAFLFSITYSWWEVIGFFRILSPGKITFFKLTQEVHSIFQFGYEGLLGVGILFMLVALIIPNKENER